MTNDNYRFQDDTRPLPAEQADEAAKAREEADGAHLGEPPLEMDTPKVRSRVTEAAGLPAIGNTMKYGFDEMGPARSVRVFLAMNKVDGFDCQSCAWPSPDPPHRKVAEFCENGAKAAADELMRRRIRPSFFERHGVAELMERSDRWLNSRGRLTHPMVRWPGATHYTPIAWDDAFDLVASELRALGSPDEAIFYTSGKTCNEPAFAFQLFARQLGTNNLPDCSNMCHESSGTALTETIGIGKGTATLDDLEHCDLIVNIGNNPGTNHPRMLTSLQAAKRRGAQMIAINPMPETGLMRVANPNPQDYPNPLMLVPALLGPGAALADFFVPVRVNGDTALVQGIIKSLLQREREAPGSVVDRAFVEQYTTGFEAFREGVERTPWPSIVAGSGVDRATIEAAAERIARAKRMVILWCTGLTQHPNGVENVEQVINLLLLGGHIGRPGAGPICVRGHSNVQGDRTMGVWERPRAEFLDALDREFGLRAPRHSGLDTVESLHAMYGRRAKIFFAISGNLLSAAPDTQYAADALSRCRLTVQVSTKLNRGHLVTGEMALILPCLGRGERDLRGGSEQFATVEDTMGIVNPSRGHERPASGALLSEVEIIVRLARATLGDGGPVDWKSMLDNDRIRDHIARVIPGFEDFNARIRRGPFYLPNGARERVFHTPSGKAVFSVCALPEPDLGPGELLMTTVRSHDQFNTTIYGLNDRYRGVFRGRRVVFVHPDDLAELGIAPGSLVDITSHFKGEKRVARRFEAVAYPIARRSAATYFPEANVLVPIGSVAARSNQPAHKCVKITLQASEPGSRSAGVRY